MRYLRIVTAFAGSYWAMQEDKWNQIRSFLRFASGGGSYTAEELAEVKAARSRRETGKSQAQAIAVIPVYGIISQKVDSMDDISVEQSAGTERIARDLKAALADPDVSAILLDVNSPGGTVYGVAELAREIYAARKQKRIAAIANSLAASAAYWIATAAGEFYITPSGEAGSIGVFIEHLDISKWLENEGLKPTLIKAGDYKVEANAYEALGEDAAKFLQQRVNDYYGMFVKAVARNRNTTEAKVRNDFGRGRVFGADQAVAVGMADKVLHFDAVLKLLADPATAPQNQEQSALIRGNAIAEVVDMTTLKEEDVAKAFRIPAEMLGKVEDSESTATVTFTPEPEPDAQPAETQSEESPEPVSQEATPRVPNNINRARLELLKRK
jgi:signal peptide peptidase SppA